MCKHVLFQSSDFHIKAGERQMFVFLLLLPLLSADCSHASSANSNSLFGYSVCWELTCLQADYKIISTFFFFKNQLSLRLLLDSYILGLQCLLFYCCLVQIFFYVVFQLILRKVGQTTLIFMLTLNHFPGCFNTAGKTELKLQPQLFLRKKGDKCFDLWRYSAAS